MVIDSPAIRLAAARRFGQAGQLDELVRCCEDIISNADPRDIEPMLEAGALLLRHGCVSAARSCFERVEAHSSSDPRVAICMASVLLETGNASLARQKYQSLLGSAPSEMLYRNIIACMQYDNAASAAERLAMAAEWARWSRSRVPPEYSSRPRFRSNGTRRLRVGYVSADFCQHTVGLLVLPVITAHNRNRIEPFAYSSGDTNDWVTAAIREATNFRSVRDLDDTQLAALIRQDEIDVLVDLGGHTAGSRLSAFLHRPAPVQVSWLGYFATTGTDCIDAVLLDQWHAPAGTEVDFVESIARLRTGRFCYRPPPWAVLPVEPPPCLVNGFVTFGCFNNTAKLSPAVFDVWAKILMEVADAKLVLKWRTFSDAETCEGIASAFALRGIDPARISFRTQSVHAALLREYGDIDIALDPFPFTGGVTTFESLWMGVPVVTWPQDRVVSRQSHAILMAMGVATLSACDADEYCRIAVTLARDTGRLTILRDTLRRDLQASPMLQEAAFVQEFEQTLTDIHRITKSRENSKQMPASKILHVGCGHRDSGAHVPAAFQTPDWQELRLDINPANKPDIVGSMLQMPAVADASVDAVYSAHNIEHVYAHEVPTVLQEFLRVLKPDGYAILTCPDLQSVCALVAEDRLTDVAYLSPAGPITPLDILYGHGAALASGNHFMAHKGGFTLTTLITALQAAGFQTVAGKRRPHGLDIWVLATKSPMPDQAIRNLAEQLLPA